MKLTDRFRDPKTWARLHGSATVVWALLIPATVAWWRESVAWIALMSVWANFVGHFSGWQASRAERAANGSTSLPLGEATPPGEGPSHMKRRAQER